MIAACGGNKLDKDEQTGSVADSTVQLAKAVCSACHDFVPPEMLDKKTWVESVLPWMAPKMGIYEWEGRQLRSEKEDPFAPKELYPDKPMISPVKFREIVKYFETMAPDQLPLQKREKLIGAITGRFIPKKPQLPPTEAPMTTFVSIVEGKNIIAGVGGNFSRLGAFGKDLAPKWFTSLPSPPSWVESTGNEMLITTMGSIMPSNKKEGKLFGISVPGIGNPAKPREILSNLPRPVQIRRLDMNGDGTSDYLINGFGHLAGRLYWQKTPSSAPEVLRDYPGAIQTEITDWDGDGKKDVLTLFTQNYEGVYLFRNLGNGKYEEKRLIAFPPVYGSSSFALADVNGDNKQDIIYTCGDNADYSVVLKPYHGVYIFLNQGNDQFKQAWFYPIHGCYKALVRDFDLDGDLDMVTIGFFADYLTQPVESLLYLENEGGLNYTPYSIAGFNDGRWLTCDAGDLDGDGDEDVVVGNFSQGPQSFMSQEQPIKWSSEPIFMYLENTTK